MTIMRSHLREASIVLHGMDMCYVSKTRRVYETGEDDLKSVNEWKWEGAKNGKPKRCKK